VIEAIDNKRIGVIDGLRGFAIIFIIYGHTLGIILVKKFPYLISNGWIGVNLFFILSGFVLYRPYSLKFRKLDSKEDVFSFYKRRFDRLYPLFIINIVISFVLGFTPEIGLGFKALIFTILTISSFTFGLFIPAFNMTLWSLPVEIWFSILFPVLLFGFNKWGLKSILIFVLCLSFLLRFTAAYFFSYHNLPAFNWVLARIDDFVIGIFICDLFYLYSKIFVFLKKYSKLFVLVAFSFFILTLFFADLRFAGKLPFFIVPFLNNVIQLNFVLFILLALTSDNIINKICSMWIFRLLGAMCFSLYVWHFIILQRFFYTKDLLVNFSVFKLAVYLFFTFILSILSYRYIEFGSEKSLKKLFLLE